MSAVEFLNLSGHRRTPMVHQSEAAECGLACLAMVAGHYGLHADMAALRRRYGISLKGTTLKALLDVAEEVGFNARALRGEIDDLLQVPLPAILFWDMDHFVVLTRVRRGARREFVIHDPSSGIVKVREEELSRHFSGVFVEMVPSRPFQKQRESSGLAIGQLWSRITGLWSSLRNVVALSAVLQLIALASPFYLQLAVDDVFPALDRDFLLILAVGFAGLSLVNALTTWLRALMLIALTNALTYQVVANLFRHLLRLPLPWFEKRHVGDIISRFNSTNPISNIISQGLASAIIDGVMAFLTLGLMVVYSPLLSIVALAAWLIYAGLKIAFLRSLRTKNVSSITASAKENSAFIETVRGIAALKAFGQEAGRTRRWQMLKADAVNAQMELGRFSAGFDAAGQIIMSAERILFVYIALRLAMNGEFTIGMIFAFQAYKQQFLDAATRLVEQGVQYKLVDVHLSRIADIALARPEPGQNGSIGSLERLSGGIELKNVLFRYGASEPEVLRNVNLVVEPGEMIALIGPSGGGKTTLLKVMMGLFEPTLGQVLVDGAALSTIGLTHWRKQIGTVAQDDMLFAGTIAENIAFFDPEIDMERVFEVSRLVGLHGDIQRMPMRYDSLVGDMGSALSGGQRQRVLLARALYPDPALLFIDEGTAHLDPMSEQMVMRTLQKLPITRIVSAHRPLPVQAADKVYLVRDGVASLIPNDLEQAGPGAKQGRAAAGERQPEASLG